MDSVKVKSFAKLNLTLFVTGAKDGFHMLDSIAVTVDLYDSVKVKKRRDGLVSVRMYGMGSENIPYESNNAVKAAKAFSEKYGCGGADITVYKNIPIGLGAGGSSADAAGVLKAMSRLYKVDDVAGIKLLADSLGSDTKYMLSGGYARLTGRGDAVKKLESGLKLSFLLLAPQERISTAQCFKEFDVCGTLGGDGDKAEKAVLNGDLYGLAESMGNSLYPAAKRLSGEVETAYRELEAFSPLAVGMTGSGSGVYALFETDELCEYAKSRYNGKFTPYCLKTVL